MNKLTTEQLLFAHRIGATHYLTIGYVDEDGCTGHFWHTKDAAWSFKRGWEDERVDMAKQSEIDFSPLYDWIEHDGGECPVRDGDVVKIVVDGEIINDWFVAGRGDWRNVQQFKLQQPEDWPEQRADAIGQNSNTGEHYADIPPPEYDPRDVAFKPTKSKYHREIAPGVWIDVYDVLKAWKVENPALQHLIKKALQPGERGQKTLDQDMKDIVASAIRAQELASKPED